MTRYRKPQAPGSRYATPEGAKRLRDELDHLWRVLRPQVTRAVQEAAAQGDRSENAEYIYGKTAACGSCASDSKAWSS
jgi:transcription elongation factor GreB